VCFSKREKSEREREGDREEEEEEEEARHSTSLPLKTDPSHLALVIFKILETSSYNQYFIR